MRAHRLIPAWVAALGLAAVLLPGCSKKNSPLEVANQPPTIRLTNAPVTSTDPVYYAYKLNWIAYDPDGRVASYQYAIDPPTVANADTPWVTTTRNEQIFFFRSATPESIRTFSPQGQDFHTFVIRAVDNLGATSLPIAREFFSYTVAPRVQITSPVPSPLLEPILSPAVQINWVGFDDDGVFTQKPVKYKFKLFKLGPDIPWEAWLTEPDSLRRTYAPTFAGWDSSSADTTFTKYTNLVPNAQYLFVVVAFDEAGAYSPRFSRNTNMLAFSVGFAGNLGPKISLFNDFFFFTYPSGGYTVDAEHTINLEIPSDKRVNLFWFAQPPPGAEMRRYRWALDIADLDDDTPRTNEATDLRHWSQWQSNSFGTTLGPFAGTPDEQHYFYLEAEDINGLVSLGIVLFHVVKATFEKPLLIVDDTRLLEDRSARNPSNPDSMLGPLGVWPTAAELDTFLYAKGGFRWRSTTPVGGVQRTTTPGIFAGYPYDTMGTRFGLENPIPQVSLLKLSKYRHIVWYVDGTSSLYKQGEIGGGPGSAVQPQTVLRYMTDPNRQNTLASWLVQGGRLWLAGGGAGNATIATWNNRPNDPQRRLYTSFGTNPELVSGRFMYDAIFWRSEFAPIYGGVQRIRRIDVPDPSFDPSQPPDPSLNPYWPGGSYYTRPLRPEYAFAPEQMLPKTVATDPLPPQRNGSDFYINTNTNPKGIDLEYLSQDNSILVDPDGEPDTGDEFSVLDTLYISPRAANGMHAFEDDGKVNPTMTIYRGPAFPEPIVFTGFDFWHFRRQDCQQLVDFVLQHVWNLPYSPSPPPGAPSPTAVRRPTAARH